LKKLLLRGENFVKLYILLAAFGVAASQAVPLKRGKTSITFAPFGPECLSSWAVFGAIVLDCGHLCWVIWA